MNIIAKLIDKYWNRRKNIDVDKFYIYWKHRIPHFNTVKMDFDRINFITSLDVYSPGTECFIKYNGKLVAEGRSFMSESEKQFCKRTGRKYSMERAIEKLNLTKEQRTQLYNKYLSSIKG